MPMEAPLELNGAALEEEEMSAPRKAKGKAKAMEDDPVATASEITSRLTLDDSSPVLVLDNLDDGISALAFQVLTEETLRITEVSPITITRAQGRMWMRFGTAEESRRARGALITMDRSRRAEGIRVSFISAAEFEEAERYSQDRWCPSSLLEIDDLTQSVSLITTSVDGGSESGDALVSTALPASISAAPTVSLPNTTTASFDDEPARLPLASRLTDPIELPHAERSLFDRLSDRPGAPPSLLGRLSDPPARIAPSGPLPLRQRIGVRGPLAVDRPKSSSATAKRKSPEATTEREEHPDVPAAKRKARRGHRSPTALKEQQLRRDVRRSNRFGGLSNAGTSSAGTEAMALLISPVNMAGTSNESSGSSASSESSAPSGSRTREEQQDAEGSGISQQTDVVMKDVENEEVLDWDDD
ncbi:hypothetical protein FB45DRAFT_1032073 [Roridomyces roridus]|uniref:Uncharacterized protein n=1 Tax=Roridomyces roridus TaxID=1738132 RepID=A0AAD7FGD3_9AGAR|nr:hypothetical protein FB45DRAFT_1032073 [Roridomyces roridus]